MVSHPRSGSKEESYGGDSGTAWRGLPWYPIGRLSTAGVVALVACVCVGAALVGARTAAGANPAVSVVTASTAETSTTNFTSANATATCAPGTTLVGGGDQLTRGGAPNGIAGGTPPLSTTPVPNDGNVTLGVYPSNSGGMQSPSGTVTPGSWTATGGYSGQAPGTDYVSSYAMCASNVTAATIVEVAVTATQSLGPVTAQCPAGDSLVGGGGGYTEFPPGGGNNTKLLNSYPSDGAGDVPVSGATNPTSWTVKGNSNNPTGASTTTAIAVCSTGVTVPTVVETAANNDDNPPGSGAVPGGTTLPATASCAGGTTLLGGGSFVTSIQGGNVGGPGNGGQGVHLIGDFPGTASSGTTSSPVVSGAAGSSWTAMVQNGGQNLDALNVEAFALCMTKASPTLTTQASGGIDLGGGAVSDSATLAAGVNPTGSITFDLYGPSSSPNCSGSPVFTSSANVTGNGEYESGSFTPIQPGTYYWTASYSGDGGDNGTSGGCGAANESVHVEGAAEQLNDLLALVTGVGPGNSLAAKVQAAISSFQKGANSTCNQLGALLNEVGAQSGKQLPAVQANTIIADVNRIQTLLGC